VLGADRITPRFWAACAALAVLLHEAHELAHTAVGRVLCGGWGPRDFNAWALPPGCESPVPTLAGPLFSYLVIWAGWALLRDGGVATDRRRLAGLALVLMANPFARLFTAAMGGGDEGVLVRGWLGLERGPLATAITFALVAAVTAVPLAAAWRAAPREGRAWRFPLLLVLPMLVTGILLFAAGNRLLARGVLREPVIAGAPLLVWLATLLAALALTLSRRAARG
jgi:hypothetical protein